MKRKDISYHSSNSLVIIKILTFSWLSLCKPSYSFCWWIVGQSWRHSIHLARFRLTRWAHFLGWTSSFWLWNLLRLGSFSPKVCKSPRSSGLGRTKRSQGALGLRCWMSWRNLLSSLWSWWRYGWWWSTGRRASAASGKAAVRYLCRCQTGFHEFCSPRWSASSLVAS